ncbi:MAG: hypothetical protein ACI9SC_001883 [Gammaproteobacteria bacterium]|jgi:uncharacterized protein (DUF2132 family)
MKLIVRNLARNTTEAALRVIFETYGKVQFCTVIVEKETGNSKGFGFVEMPKQGDAKAAMKNVNGMEVDGNKIRVKKAESSTDTDEAPKRIIRPDVKDPLHGVTLEMILRQLVEKYGWQEMGRRITIKCFTEDPSVASSLKFLRRTPWARQKVEILYLDSDSQDDDRPARKKIKEKPVEEKKVPIKKTRWKPKTGSKKRVWGKD